MKRRKHYVRTVECNYLSLALSTGTTRSLPRVETGTTSSDSSPVAACVTRSFTIPVSTTYLIPGMVTEDSARFVERITLRVLGGGGVNTTSCCSGGSAA